MARVAIQPNRDALIFFTHDSTSQCNISFLLYSQLGSNVVRLQDLKQTAAAV